ncbi:uncharacterized protein [Periplaneta americana]|uniref:uncharacterized protein isoform X1 n=1 Tax=Periplaneta americana TaxID=6978 RepID=UPI0037E880D1
MEGYEIDPGAGANNKGHLSEIEQLKIYLEHIKLQMENKLRQKRKQLEEELEAEYSRYKNYLEQHFLRIKERLEYDLKMGTNGEDLTCSELLSDKDRTSSNRLEIRIEDYRKRSSSADGRGLNFETKMLALLFMRGVNTTPKFSLASNVAGVGQFDDIVFAYMDETQNDIKIMFIQLKHKQNVYRKKTRNISAALLSLRGDYSVPQYCKSYPEVMKWLRNRDITSNINIDNVELVLFTNNALHTNTLCPDGQHSVLFTEGEVYCFTEENDTYIYNLFQQLETYGSFLHEFKAREEDSTEKLEEMKKQISSVDIRRKLIELERDANKISREINDWGNLSHYKDFLSRFKVYSLQSDESGLDMFIKKEIQTACGTGTSATGIIFERLLKEIHNWWEKESFFLTEEALFWRGIMQARINEFNDDLVRKLNSLNIRFNEENVSKCKEIISDNTTLHISPMKHDSSLLVCLKVHQSLGNNTYLMVEGKAFESHESELFILWEKWCDLLILVDDGYIPYDFFHSCPRKRFICISETKPHTDCFTVCDDTNLDQLDEVSQQKVLSSVVNFQGHDIPFRKLAGDKYSLVDGNIIMQLLSEKVVLGDELFGDLEYYIPRTLRLVGRVRQKILRNMIDAPVTFAVSGLSDSELQQMAPHAVKFEAMNTQNEDLDHCGVVAVESEDDFIQLAKPQQSVHWLCRQNSGLLWKESRGDIRTIKNWIQLSKTNLFENVDSIADVPHRLVLVSAESGMGKSTLLSHLALGIKHMNPSMWVIRVNLNDFTNLLEVLPEDVDLAHVITFILEVSGIPSEWRDILRMKLVKMEEVCMLFDGYDEISPTHAGKVTLMLQHLQASKVQKLWVTTRPVMKQRLEQDLSTLAFTLQPFSDTVQANFLAKFWKKTFSEINEINLSKFIVKLQHLTATNLNDKERYFLGIPLQSRLLAEAFEDDLRNYIETEEIGLPLKVDLIQLCNRFVQRKFEISCEKNNVDKTKPGLIQDYEELRETFEQNHMLSALLAILPNAHVKKLPGSDIIINRITKFSNRIEEGREKTGIIKEIVNGKPVFIHRTFSEYFAALWFARNYEFVRNLLTELLFDLNFQVLRNFFDRIVAQEFELHVAVVNQDKTAVDTLLLSQNIDVNAKDHGGRTALFLAVMNYIDSYSETSCNVTNQVLQTLLRYGADPNIRDDVLNWSPLCLGDKIRAWPAVDLLLGSSADAADLLFTKLNMCNNAYVQEMLRVASINGLVNLIAFMLNNGIPVGYWIRMGYGRYRCEATMLHIAAKHGQLDLVKYLAKSEADVEAQDRGLYKRTPLIWAAEEGELEVVKFLKDHGASVTSCDWCGNTALLRAAKNGKFAVVSLLLRESEITAGDQFGNNILHIAAKTGNVELVTQLLDAGLHVDCYNYRQQTPLWLAAWFGRVPVARLLLQRGADLNLQDSSDGFTPLHAAASGGHLQIVQCLVDHAANLRIYSKSGRTPLHVAIAWKHTAVADFIANSSNY